MDRWLIASTILLLVGCSGKIDGKDGAGIFAKNCARCHGAEGVPSKGLAKRTGVKSLVSERVRTELSDADLRERILNGAKSKAMPAFQGALTDEQLTAVVAHLRAMGKAAEAAAEEAAANKPSP